MAIKMIAQFSRKRERESGGRVISVGKIYCAMNNNKSIRFIAKKGWSGEWVTFARALHFTCPVHKGKGV